MLSVAVVGVLVPGLRLSEYCLRTANRGHAPHLPQFVELTDPSASFAGDLQKSAIPVALLYGGGINTADHAGTFAHLAATFTAANHAVAHLSPHHVDKNVGQTFNAILRQFSGLETAADDLQASPIQLLLCPGPVTVRTRVLSRSPLLSMNQILRNITLRTCPAYKLL